MDLTYISEIWNFLRSYISINDINEAAEQLVSYLIDNDCEASEIKEAFRGDKALTTALQIYTTDNYIEDEYEEKDQDADDEW